MAAASDDIHVRLPRKLKRSAQKIIEANGLDLSGAIKLFFVQITVQKTIPLKFASFTENGLTKEFEDELLALSKDRKNFIGPFTSTQALLKSLNEED